MKKILGALVSVAVLLIGSVWVVGNATGQGSSFTKHTVKVYFTSRASLDKNCSGKKVFTRKTVGADVLHDALSLLMRGPRASERKKGAVSPFSAKTAGMLNSVTIKSGTAYVDFDDFRKVIPEASSSCGSASLLSELKRTAKQFPSVDRAVFSFEGGNVKAFYNWLQLDPPA